MQSKSLQVTPIPTPRKNVEDELVRVNLLVPVSLRKEWKALALESDKTLTQVIIEAMTRQVSRNTQNENSKK
ncbi:hypothetical protein KUF54_11165 [Comamonas sp. Y33R10-2]|uniref:hypothetical protein n=1 Tax=Comamonas sp. Y33R10-2 TaxID=2853257 RepID=UPI001C5C9663|nr:hypothetical protein [Comamonas sp. Y33R10-2]QXZ08630.1 hypothetical protein KUF54_11165 [Comamonas sp. Y33R10-2]